MKKLLIIATVCIVSFGGIYYFLYYKPAHTPVYSPLDSRSRMGTDDAAEPEIKAVALPSPDPSAMSNLKQNLPYTTDKFSASWNEAHTEVNVLIQAPYTESTAALISWLTQIKANDVPIGTLKIIKQ